jgi:hypothetical protein
MFEHPNFLGTVDEPRPHHASQGRSDDAHALLQPVFEQFVEGSNAADLKAAERLLATLR